MQMFGFDDADDALCDLVDEGGIITGKPLTNNALPPLRFGYLASTRKDGQEVGIAGSGVSKDAGRELVQCAADGIGAR